MGDSYCADCGGFDVEWMYKCQKHHLEYCRGCSCSECDEEAGYDEDGEWVAPLPEGDPPMTKDEFRAICYDVELKSSIYIGTPVDRDDDVIWIRGELHFEQFERLYTAWRDYKGYPPLPTGCNEVSDSDKKKGQP